MPDQAPDQPTPAEAREALHVAIDHLSDQGVLALWELLRAWVAQHADETEEDEEC
jgi:hypothetical protein